MKQDITHLLPFTIHVSVQQKIKETPDLANWNKANGIAPPYSGGDFQIKLKRDPDATGRYAFEVRNALLVDFPPYVLNGSEVRSTMHVAGIADFDLWINQQIISWFNRAGYNIYDYHVSQTIDCVDIRNKPLTWDSFYYRGSVFLAGQSLVSKAGTYIVTVDTVNRTLVPHLESTLDKNEIKELIPLAVFRFQLEPRTVIEDEEPRKPMKWSL